MQWSVRGEHAAPGGTLPSRLPLRLVPARDLRLSSPVRKKGFIDGELRSMTNLVSGITFSVVFSVAPVADVQLVVIGIVASLQYLN